MNNIIAIIIIFIISSSANIEADGIIPPYENYRSGVSSSLEGIFSIEKAISKKTSILFWGGGGIVVVLTPNRTRDYSAGIEGALEFRYYPTNENNRASFVGLYQSIGYMYGPPKYSYDDDEYKYHLVQSFGGKVGYKLIAYGRDDKSSRLRLAIEPYTSVGVSIYYHTTIYSDSHFTDHAVWWNLGLRLVIEYRFI